MQNTNLPPSVKAAIVEAFTKVIEVALDAAAEQPKPPPAPPHCEEPIPRWRAEVQSHPIYDEHSPRVIATRHRVLVEIPADATDREAGEALINAQSILRSAVWNGRPEPADRNGRARESLVSDN